MSDAPRTWRDVIQRIAEQHHGGHYYPIAGRAGVSAGLVHQWKTQAVATPSVASVVKIARAYGLDVQALLGFAVPADVRQLLAAPRPARKPRPIRGGSAQAAPLPEASPTPENAAYRTLGFSSAGGRGVLPGPARVTSSRRS